MQFGPRARVGLLLCVASAVFTLLVLYVVFAQVGKSEAQAKPETTTASGIVVQQGSPLQTNEARSTIPGGDLLACTDTNDNGRVGMCRMKDRESGDIRTCRDPTDKDAVGCIQPGVSGRHYDWHQNGYRTCWTCANHWSNQKSLH